MEETCLILIPRLSKKEYDAEDVLRQKEDVETFRMAVRKADLAEPEVVEVIDVSSDLDQGIREADFVVIDANFYGKPLSPSISHTIATGHAIGKRTILLTRSIDHLPTGMRHNVVVYEDGVKLISDFRKLVEKLRSKAGPSLGGKENLDKGGIAKQKVKSARRSKRDRKVSHEAPAGADKTQPEAAPSRPPDSSAAAEASWERHALSPLARRILTHADSLALAIGAEPRIPLTSSLVLIAIVEIGKKEETAASCRWLYERLSSDLGEEELAASLQNWTEWYPTATQKRWLKLGQDMTATLRMTLEWAENFAQATTGNPKIHARHLLAVLIDPEHGAGYGAADLLDALAQDREALAAAFLRFVTDAAPADKQAVWHQTLLPGETGARVPVFKSEDAHGADRLGITRHVNAFASLMAAESLHPPLAIGIFGDWGSGKSFFMRKLRERIEWLAKTSGERLRKNLPTAFHSRIVQIEFNAWHYVESNLWASLVEHIFRNLRLSEDEEEKEVEARREELLRNLDRGMARQVEAERKLDLAQKKRQDAARALEASRRAKEDVAGETSRFRSIRLWDLIQLGEKEKAALTAALKSMGINRVLESREEVEATVAELRTISSRGRALWLSATQAPDAPWRVLLLLGLMALVPLAGVLFPMLATKLDSQVAERLGQIITFVAAAAAWLRGQLARAAKLTAGIDTAVKAVDSKLATERQRRAKELNELEEKLKKMSDDYDRAKKCLEEAQQAVREAEEGLAELTPGRRLAHFIDQRVASDDYRKHLGVLALVRRDFARLDRLMRQSTQGLPEEFRIDRIVLYIDDLDRCPPHRVVDVLQAIHLLLALPLFVVVVGVCGRSHYSHLLRSRYFPRRWGKRK